MAEVLKNIMEEPEKNKDRKHIDAEITEKYKLTPKEMFVLGDLDIKGSNPEDINTGIDVRFKREIDKA